MKLNWGHYITLSFIAFAGVIFVMAYISMNTDVNLVAEDYYKQEIAYQDQIDKITNYKNLIEKPVFRINAATKVLEISFSDTLYRDFSKGDLLLFRPSQSNMDKLYKISLDEKGEQFIVMKGLDKGLWKAKINFQIGESLYYHEKNIML